MAGSKNRGLTLDSFLKEEGVLGHSQTKVIEEVRAASAMQPETHRSEIMAAVHETAEDLHEVGLIGKRTMREFGALCSVPASAPSPSEIKARRDTA